MKAKNKRFVLVEKEKLQRLSELLIFRPRLKAFLESQSDKRPRAMILRYKEYHKAFARWLLDFELQFKELRAGVIEKNE